jgi:hypothetical protein
MSDNFTNDMYMAIVQASVSESSATNSFESVRSIAKNKTTSEFLSICASAEEQYKKDFECSVMPNPYRSAKSVIKTALSLNIDFENKGKTEIQKEIKDSRKPKEVIRTTIEEFRIYYNKAAKIYGTLSSEDKQHYDACFTYWNKKCL